MRNCIFSQSRVELMGVLCPTRHIMSHFEDEAFVRGAAFGVLQKSNVLFSFL